jgi:hypothetical protein
LEASIDSIAPFDEMIGLGKAYLSDDENLFYWFYEMMTGDIEYKREKLEDLKNNPKMIKKIPILYDLDPNSDFY